MHRALFASLLLTLDPACSQAQVFADFELKNGPVEFGRFTAQLDHLYSPHAVANFIRLAEGLVPWIDAEGIVRTGPFYDGLTFHDTTSGFEVVTGSPSGNGNDGPGWINRDDFRSSGSAQYSLFMDNEGPNTNGSRFFINLTTTLNPNRQGGQYSRFGQVLIPTNPPPGNGRITLIGLANIPGGHIIIDSVKLRYNGADAQNFRQRLINPSDPVLFTLPSSREAVFSFRHQSEAILLDWDTTPGSGVQLWGSLDLQTWTGPLSVFNVPGSTEFGYDLTSTIAFRATGFFRGGVVEYPDWPSTDRPLTRASIQTHFLDPNVGQLISTYSFDGTGRAGTYLSALGSGDFTVTSLVTRDPYTTEIVLTPDTGSQPSYRLILHYDLAWTTAFPNTALPATANPSRLDGSNVAHPGNPLINGGWSYLPAP